MSCSRVADSIKLHSERKQKAEHYQLSQMLEIPTEFGVLTVVGPMIQKAIEMAKLNREIIALEAAWASAGVAKQSAASRAFMDAPYPLRPRGGPPGAECRR